MDVTRLLYHPYGLFLFHLYLDIIKYVHCLVRTNIINVLYVGDGHHPTMINTFVKKNRMVAYIGLGVALTWIFSMYVCAK